MQGRAGKAGEGMQKGPREKQGAESREQQRAGIFSVFVFFLRNYHSEEQVC